VACGIGTKDAVLFSGYIRVSQRGEVLQSRVV